MGWADYNDLATASTPISLTLADTFYDLTNDGLGGFTNKNFIIPGHGEIWNADTGRFDFSSLKLGDTVDLRIHCDITTTGPNREVELVMDLGIGGSPYTLDLDHHTHKASGTYSMARWFGIYMGDANTRDNPAKLAIKCDDIGTTVKVLGWYVRSLSK